MKGVYFDDDDEDNVFNNDKNDNDVEDEEDNVFNNDKNDIDDEHDENWGQK